MPEKKHLHFEGKSSLEHLIDARQKGAAFDQEVHGSELTGYKAAFFHAAKESSMLLVIALSFLTTGPYFPVEFFAIYILYTLWKVSYASLQGFAKLERLHQIIEQERWEITHHREQEKEELYELYRAKGFSGQLLEDSITTLMSDDNRLLEVMLQEEIGLKIGQYEHPIKASIGAFFGCLLPFTLFFIYPALGAFSAFLMMSASLFSLGYIESKLEKTPWMTKTFWLTSIGVTLFFSSHFLLRFFSGE